MENSGQQKSKYKESFLKLLIKGTLLRHLSVPLKSLCPVFFTPIMVLSAHWTALDINTMLANLSFALRFE